MNKIKKLAFKIAAPAMFFAVPTLSALAQTPPKITPVTNLNTIADLGTRITNIANVLLGFLGLVGVIMIIYGAYLYVTAGTNEDNTKKAKAVLTYAIIGLAVAVLSYAIVMVSIDFISKGGS